MSAPSTAAIGTKYAVPGKHWAAGHHTGVDFLCATGSTLKAPVQSKIIHAGKNSSTGWGSAYGIHVIGECTVGSVKYRWIVAHLRSVSVKAGQTVRRGMNLGYSNSTGNVTGPHCHFEVRKRTSKGTYPYGSDVNPKILIAVTSGSASTDRMDPAAYFLGAHGEHVTWLGGRLQLHLKALRIASPYKAGPGPLFTDVDREAVTLIQLHLGFRGKDADGFPGATTLKLLASTPTATPPSPVKFKAATATSLNCGGYDTVHGGKKTAVARVPKIAKAVTARSPHWVHLQECSAPMLAAMDREMKERGYKRVPQGGKGRESYYRTDVGIEVTKAQLRNVTTELDGDDKPFLIIVWERETYRAIDVNFHNENEGNRVQKPQLEEIENLALDWAKKYGVRGANMLVTGDTNRKESIAEQRIRNWADIGTDAPKRTNEEYHSTNAGGRSTKGRRIDVDMVRYNAEMVEYEQTLDPIVSDHNVHFTHRRLFPAAASVLAA